MPYMQSSKDQSRLRISANAIVIHWLINLEQCDLQTPTCGNCEKGGRQCSGLSSVFVRVHGSDATCMGSGLPHSTPRSMTWKIPNNRRTKVRKPWHQHTGHDVPRSTGQQPLRENMEVTHYGGYSTSLASIQSLPTNGREQLTLQLVHTLESTAETGFTLWILGDYI
jgi:hypothetical protein